MGFLFNHLGFAAAGIKRAVFQTKIDSGNLRFSILDSATLNKMEQVETRSHGAVEGWKGRYFYQLDFSSFNKPGRYILKKEDGEVCYSEIFEISNENPESVLLPGFFAYFRAMRCTGEQNNADKKAPFFGGRNDRVDVSGGWYDASGDTGKYLSHLSYANYMNPQQIPALVWQLLDSLSCFDNRHPLHKKLALEEAAYGCDFLVRMNDPEGYFYMNIYDGWTKDPGRRMICSWRTLEGTKEESYQCAFRQGAGMAAAALARAAAMDISGEFPAWRYLETADKAYRHLLFKNIDYCDNNRENLIDEYCALFAACELYIAAEDNFYQAEAEKWAQKVINRQKSDGNYLSFWENDADVPYFHAAEAGFPMLSLLRFLEIFPENKLAEKAAETLHRAAKFELKISREVYNPFLYPRQYTVDADGSKKSSFFIPHNNWTGYWWQGENARLASLVSALRRYDKTFPEKGQDFALFTRAMLDWILGCNPFDLCMVHGKGRNNPEYRGDNFNLPGGVVNGITSGMGDENDIAFRPAEGEDGLNTWRWSEQWLVHAGWLYHALCSGL